MRRNLDLRKLNKALIVFIRCRLKRYRTKNYAAGAVAVITILLAGCSFIPSITIGNNSKDMMDVSTKPAIANPAIVSAAEPEKTSAEIKGKAAQKEYATPHKEEIPEDLDPLTTSPLPLSDIYVESGSIAVFKCHYPDAEDYIWETCDENGEWISAPVEDVLTSTDELYRQISLFMVSAADKKQDGLMVRCNVKRTGTAETTTEKATLHILPRIETVSADDYTAKAGTYISVGEIPVQVSFSDGSKDTVTGLGGLYFLEKEESSEHVTEESGNMTETITTVITAHDYMYLNGEKDVLLRYQGSNESTDIPIRLIGEDTTAPCITQVIISDFEISTVDEPVTVTVKIIAEDDITADPDLKYAFLPEGEEPSEEQWTDQSSFDADITMNGKWIAYCRDEGGNIAKEEKELVVVDNKAPVVQLSLESETWCTKNKILVNAKDGLSMEYCYSCAQTGEDSGWTTKNEHVITKNGTWKVRVRDAAGNITEEEITIDNIDNQPPVIRGINIMEQNEIEEENNNQ